MGRRPALRKNFTMLTTFRVQNSRHRVCSVMVTTIMLRVCTTFLAAYLAHPRPETRSRHPNWQHKDYYVASYASIYVDFVKDFENEVFRPATTHRPIIAGRLAGSILEVYMVLWMPLHPGIRHSVSIPPQSSGRQVRLPMRYVVRCTR